MSLHRALVETQMLISSSNQLYHEKQYKNMKVGMRQKDNLNVITETVAVLYF